MRVLIDVDGVLLRQNIFTPQADCLVEAALEVGGAEAAARALSWDWVGRTDLDILDHAVGRARMPDAAAEYLRRFRHACPKDMLEEANEQVRIAVVEASEDLGFPFYPLTGNLEAVARMKLMRAGYGPYLILDGAGYGEAGSRPNILRGLLHRLGGPEDVVYVGDTWRDMAAASLAGVRFIGWETEKHRGELDNAEWLVRNSDELVNTLGNLAFGDEVTLANTTTEVADE